MNAIDRIIARLTEIDTEIQSITSFGRNAPLVIREKYQTLVEEEATLKNELINELNAAPRLIRRSIEAKVAPYIK